MEERDILFTTLMAQVVGIRQREQESSGEARGGKEDVSDFGKYPRIEARRADFSIDKQISALWQERERERERARGEL